MIVTGASSEGSAKALTLAGAHPGQLYATAGVHPHHAIDYDDATDTQLRRLARDPAVRAVGETGLDYNRNYSPRSEEHTSELQSLMRIPYAVFCLKTKQHTHHIESTRRDM